MSNRLRFYRFDPVTDSWIYTGCSPNAFITDFSFSAPLETGTEYEAITTVSYWNNKGIIPYVYARSEDKTCFCVFSNAEAAVAAWYYG